MIVIYLKVLQISQGNVANNFTPINHYERVNLYAIVLILYYCKNILNGVKGSGGLSEQEIGKGHLEEIFNYKYTAEVTR